MNEIPIISSNRSISNNYESLKRNDLYLSGYGRQWGEKMTFTTGVAYASGLLIGGSYGFLKGANRRFPTNKLLFNSILNSCSVYGPLLANKFASLSIFYFGFSGLINNISSGIPLSPALAGGLSGLLYKSVGNWKSKVIYSGTSAGEFSEFSLMTLCIAIFTVLNLASQYEFF